LAANLARLYQAGNYTKYKYRVRFCWWGAEEIGLVGSIYHVQQAQNSSTPGKRLQDYLINLNFDMLGSPNYIFGIYNGQTAKTGTSETAKNASVRITETFRNWFNNQSLPSDNTNFDGRSDYGPFLAAGIAAGGLFSGADETKTSDQRSIYEAKLGKGRGGLAGAILDPCYHKACDTVDNIDQFGYEKMVQAAAYMVEYLGQHSNLTGWLYPTGRSPVRLSDDYFPNSDYFRETNV
jgi:Zn-dependent M28 family amino/carboxypeptidase